MNKFLIIWSRNGIESPLKSSMGVMTNTAVLLSHRNSNFTGAPSSPLRFQYAFGRSRSYLSTKSKGKSVYLSSTSTLKGGAKSLLS